ncbi:MAG: putative quinol monooxygenase [Rhizobiaceae bacterium]
MPNNVHWLLKLSINEGKLDTFKTLAEEMSAATMADEPGALNYEWFLNDDQTECHIYERYTDSAATMVHLENFGTKFAERFMACVTPTSLLLYGDADKQVQEALAPLGAVLHTQFSGFAR